MDALVNHRNFFILFADPIAEVQNFILLVEKLIAETAKLAVRLLPGLGKLNIDSVQHLCLKLIDVRTVHLRNLKANLLILRVEIVQRRVHLVYDVADLLRPLYGWLHHLVHDCARSILEREPLVVAPVDRAPGRLVLALVETRDQLVDFVV